MHARWTTANTRCRDGNFQLTNYFLRQPASPRKRPENFRRIQFSISPLHSASPKQNQQANSHRHQTHNDKQQREQREDDVAGMWTILMPFLREFPNCLRWIPDEQQTEAYKEQS